jgi:hypothetical protein
MNVPACGVADEAIAASESDTAPLRIGGDPAQPAQPKDFSIFSWTLLKIRR